MKEYKLFEATEVGLTALLNRIVMALMTRCRAIVNIRNDLMARYYEQRSAAGLIITEGASPSPNGLGYTRIPGVFNKQQTEGWKKVTTMPHYPEIGATYDYLCSQLNNLGIAYIHLVNHSAMGVPVVPVEIKKLIRKNFTNSIILCGGYNKESAEAAINTGPGNLIAFGRPFINNPDLVERMANDWPLSNELHMDLFYSAGDKGYTDYKIHQQQTISA